MPEHKKRAELRAQQNLPKNFTCGGCKKVFPTGSKPSPFECPECGYGKNPPQGE